MAVTAESARRKTRAGLPKATPLGKRSSTAHVHLGIRLRVEGRERHEEHNDHGTCERERHMEAKKAMTPVAAAAAKRLIRRSGGWLHSQCSSEISLGRPSGLHSAVRPKPISLLGR
jgi:hypothetical protein